MTRPAEIRISQEPGRPARLTVRGIEVEVPRGAAPTDIGFAIVVDEARTARAPVQAVLLDEREVLEWRVLVHPDGSVTDDVGRSEPPRPRRPVRLVAGTALVAVLLMAGVAAASGLPARAPSSAALPPSSAAAPPSVAMEAIPAAPAVTPAPSPTTASPAPATPAPAAIAAPSTRTVAPITAASRTAAAVPAPVRRTGAAAVPVAPVAPVVAVRPAAPVVPAAPVKPAAPVAPTTAPAPQATAPAPSTKILSDASGRCLTGGLTVAPCNGSAAQAWSGGAGRLHNAGRCLAYGNGVVLVDCAAPRTQGWVTSARTTTNSGLCLEALDGRAVLTQCGTGKALVLTSG